MNYLKVPDSNIKLTDGSVVMLARFPGTKWVVHYGWYDYSGRRGMGWYFSSIPAQTVIPVTAQDLDLIVLIDQGKSEEPERPPIPDHPPVPGPGPDKPPYRPPCPEFDPEYMPPWPAPVPSPSLYPVDPAQKPLPPYGDTRAYFSKNDQYLLDASWITLPSIKYRDALPTICSIPDGKIVKVVSVDGVTRYYSWNGPDQRWDEKFFENDAEQLLVDYYDIEEVDEKFDAVDVKFGEVNGSINSIEASIDNLSTSISSCTESIESLQNDLEDATSELSLRIDNEVTSRQESIAAETQSRIAADQAEASSREALASRVDTKISELTTQVETVAEDIEHDFEEETNARVAADNAEIQARIQAVNAEAAARQEADDAETQARRNADERLNDAIVELTGTVSTYHAADQVRFTALESADINWNEKLASLASRVTDLETAVYHIQTIVAGDANTLLVSSNGTIKDSGVKIGDDRIDETSLTASDRTLATEKAVVRLVEASATHWSSF